MGIWSLISVRASLCFSPSTPLPTCGSTQARFYSFHRCYSLPVMSSFFNSRASSSYPYILAASYIQVLLCNSWDSYPVFSFSFPLSCEQVHWPVLGNKNRVTQPLVFMRSPAKDMISERLLLLAYSQWRVAWTMRRAQGSCQVCDTALQFLAQLLCPCRRQESWVISLFMLGSLYNHRVSFF